MRTIIYIVSNVISVGAPFLLMPILTRYLSKSEYGQLSLIITTYTLFAALLSLGYPSYMYRSYVKSLTLSRDILSSATRNILVWGAVVIAISIFIISKFEYENLFGVGLPILTIILISALVKNFYLAQMQVFVARGEAYKHLFVQLLYSVTFLTVSVIAVKFFDTGMISRLLGVVASDFLLFFVSAVLLLRVASGVSENISSDYETLEHFKFGLTLLPHLTAAILLTTTDKIIISIYSGSVANANYTIATQFASLITILSVGVGREWSRIYMVNPFQEKLLLQLGTRVAITVLFSGFLMLITPIYYLYMASERYSPDYLLIATLLIANILHAVYALLAVHFTFTGEVGKLSRYTMVALCVNVVISVSLVKPFGILGVGIGTLAGMFVKLLGVAWHFLKSRRELKESQ